MYNTGDQEGRHHPRQAGVRSGPGCRLHRGVQEAGGEVVAADTINPDEKDFSSVISKVKAAGPDAFYYGGEYPQAGPLSQQAKAAGLKVPLMGGDGIFDPKYIELAGKTSEGDLATSVGAPTERLVSEGFVDAYTAAGYKEPYGAYGAYSYDAANAIINALKVSLASAADAKSARRAHRRRGRQVAFDGATGKVAFDEFGDTTTKVLTTYKVKAESGSRTRPEEVKWWVMHVCRYRSAMYDEPSRWGQADSLPPRAQPSTRWSPLGGVRDCSSSSWSTGLSLGALYALIAVGYTVVYGIVQLINFAHGEIFMMGAFGALSTWLLIPGRAAGHLASPPHADRRHGRLGRGGPADRAICLPPAAQRTPTGSPDHRHRGVGLSAGVRPAVLRSDPRLPGRQAGHPVPADRSA